MLLHQQSALGSAFTVSVPLLKLIKSLPKVFIMPWCLRRSRTNADEVNTIVALLRSRASDVSDIEAKAAAGGLPTSVRDTISAFSNDCGGTILLGLDESANFATVAGFDPVRIRDALAGACADDLEPPVRAEIDILDFEGGAVVVAEIPQLDPRFKPCYLKSAANTMDLSAVAAMETGG